MTNVTGVLHILIGTYELLNFRNLSGQASRRGLDLHFPRYLYQNEQDRQDFQSALLALLKQVPLNVDVNELMQHWLYFYERSLGCVGVLKDWLIRAVAAALDDGNDTLSLERLHEHTLSLAQCERMALDTTEGEQKLNYMESRREHLWHLLQIGMDSTSVPLTSVDLALDSDAVVASPSKSSKTKRTRSKTVSSTNNAVTAPNETPIEPAPSKKTTRRKTKQEANASPTAEQKTPDDTATPQQPAKTTKKSNQRVGRRKPKRDPVGEQ
jgi:hypothetical protein